MSEVCRICGGSGWRLVMRKGRPTFRRHGSCAGIGLRRAAGNRVGPAVIRASRAYLSSLAERVK